MAWMAGIHEMERAQDWQAALASLQRSKSVSCFPPIHPLPSLASLQMHSSRIVVCKRTQLRVSHFQVGHDHRCLSTSTHCLRFAFPPWHYIIQLLLDLYVLTYALA